MTPQATIPRTAILGRWVLAGAGVPQILSNRWVVVEGSRIVDIRDARPTGVARFIDRPHALVLPGLINLHNHCFSELLIRGRTEDVSAETLDSNLVYGLLMPLSQLAAEVLSEQDLRAAIALGLLQVIKGGATTVMEVFRPNLAVLFEVAAQMGVRLYGAPYVFSTSAIDLDERGQPSLGIGSDSESDYLRQWRSLYDTHNGTVEDRVRVALAPHAADTCGPELLRSVRALADEHRCPITIHLAYGHADVKTIFDRYGRSPVDYLKWVGLLGPDLLATHCVYLTDPELDLLATSKTTILNCPRGYSRGAAFAPFHRFSSHGVRTVIGTDGYNMDLVSELAAAGIVSKLYAQRSDVTTARDLIDAVTVDAAAALSRSDIGRITVGARADLTIVDMSRPHFQPVSDPLKAFVWRGSGADIWGSMVDGRFLVEDGRFQLGDEVSITAAGTAAIEKLWNSEAAAKILRRCAV
jgi:cytosine/adenosine deaminase-related metal-dependent hydrolase